MTIRIKPEPADEPYFMYWPQNPRKTRWMIIDARYGTSSKKIIAKNIRNEETAKRICHTYNLHDDLMKKACKCKKVKRK